MNRPWMTWNVVEEFVNGHVGRLPVTATRPCGHEHLTYKAALACAAISRVDRPLWIVQWTQGASPPWTKLPLATGPKAAKVVTASAEVAVKKTTLWVQKWEEVESGWGTRPDGYTLHRQKEDIAAFLVEVQKRQAAQGHGDYSRLDGDPYEWDCADEKLVEKVLNSPNGIWGPGGNNAPRPKPGVNPGGWMPLNREALK